MSTKKVWFVTGASKGLGLSLVKRLLNEGYRVAATSRKLGNLEKEIDSVDNFLALEANVTDENSVKAAIAKTIETFGGIDVVVNNAGYGHLGTLEELTDREVRENFEANVFGVLNVIRQVTPHLRQKQSGYIINISSIAGFYGGFPGWGIYNATKFAVAGMTEAYAAEVNPFNIQTTVVYPGYFKTNFLLEGSLKLAENQLADYTAVRENERVHMEEIPGNQPGSPEKAAEAFIQLAEMENPPLHFFMGSDSFGLAQSKIDALQSELNTYEALTKSTDY